MSDDTRRADALASCLTAMDAGCLDADAGLLGFPELADALRPLLALASDLRALERPPAPSDAFRARLSEALAVAPAPRSLAGVPTETRLAPAVPGEVHETPTDALVRALDLVLERVCRDGVDPAVALADHPALATELRPLLDLTGALGELPAIEGPSGLFRGRLAAALAAAPPPRSLTAPSRRGTPLWRRLWRSTAFTAAAAATVLLFIGAGATYASANASPGDWLYPVKRATERAQLLLAPDATDLRLHLGFADRRLAEARADRDHAGAMLAEFSREVTAALAGADQALAAGASREEIVTPLLTWLLDVRGRLADGRDALPPTAWRAALAQVDAGIDALASGHPLSVAPIPRLGDPARLLRAHAAHVRHVAAVADRAGQRSGAVGGGSGSVDASGADGDTLTPDAASVDARTVYVVATAAVPATSSGEPTARATATQAPGSEPTRSRPSRPSVPTPTPPSSPSPTIPPVPSATATEPSTATAPPSPALTPTPAPPTATAPVSPTVPALNKPAVITEVSCDEPVLDLGKSTACHVSAYDPEGEPLHYLWVSDVPQMLNERLKDAMYYGAWGIGGGTLRVRITVYVSDRGEAGPDAPEVTRAETYVDVRLLDTGSP